MIRTRSHATQWMWLAVVGGSGLFAGAASADAKPGVAPARKPEWATPSGRGEVKPAKPARPIHDLNMTFKKNREKLRSGFKTARQELLAKMKEGTFTKAEFVEQKKALIDQFKKDREALRKQYKLDKEELKLALRKDKDEDREDEQEDRDLKGKEEPPAK